MNLGKKNSCPSTSKDIDVRALVRQNVKLQARQDKHNILLALSLILRQGKKVYVLMDSSNPTAHYLLFPPYIAAAWQFGSVPNLVRALAPAMVSPFPLPATAQPR